MIDQTIIYIALVAIALWNVIVFFTYGLDKLKAKKERWRIPEKTLLLMAACLGGAGAMLGMRVFHHKTRHTSFRIIVPLCFFAELALLGLCMYKLCLQK